MACDAKISVIMESIIALMHLSVRVLAVSHIFRKKEALCIMNDIKISIIIPVYNVEKYLKECLDSVISQTYKNIEIILVDDGSKDMCPTICDDYASKDSRVFVIHKKNGGSSDARNVGVKAASGAYGIFLDSDDYWTDSDALQKLIDRISITQSEIIGFLYHKVEEDTGKVINVLNADENMPITLSQRNEQLDYLTSRSLYIASPCNKIINMNLLRNLPFEKGKVAEDVEWCARLMEKGKSFDFINLDFYCYRQRSGSISKSISFKSCVDLKNAILGCVNIYKVCDAETTEYLGRYSAYQFATFIATQAFADVFPAECVKQLKIEKAILRYYGNSNKVKYMYYGTRVFGLKLWCKMIRASRFIWDSRRDKI